MPDVLAHALAEHLRDIRPGAGNIDLVFETTRDAASLGAAARPASGLDRVGRPNACTDELRHTALTSAAEDGATLAVLTTMAGHSTADAAQRYPHATLERARQVATAMNAYAAAALRMASE